MTHSKISKQFERHEFFVNQLKVSGFIRIFILLTASFFFDGQLDAQKLLTKSISLQMPDGGGANSCAVVWHPVLKKYYSSIIGNATFLMAVFDAKGNTLMDTMVAGNDYRGMWYNPLSKRIEFNCYDDGGWGHLTLDVKGTIKGKVIDFEGQNQPDAQSTGVYSPAGNRVLFFNNEYFQVVVYNAKTAYYDSVLTKLYAGCANVEDVLTMDDEDSEEDRWYDRNLVVQYTGLANKELAVVNKADHLIELYSAKTGLITDTYKIPDEVTLESNFNFSYSNGTWWFFDKLSRKWNGYKYVSQKPAKK